MMRPQVQWMAGIVGLVLAWSVSPALAQATDDSPPVTVPDELTLLPGGSAYVDVLANDSDDLDQQALCRARGNPDAEATVDRGKVFVNVPTDQPGDYQVHYQACDYDYLSLGTVTVHAVAPQAVEVHKVAGEPGVLRATNPNPVRVLVGWAAPRGQHLDGHVALRAGATKDFTVVRHHIVWFAVDPSSYWEDGSLVGYGEIRHIALPARTRLTPPPATSRRLTALFRSARSGVGSRHHDTGRVSAASWPNDPTTVLPPVPQTDTIHWWSGSWDRVDPTANDADPQGQSVDVCRLSPEARAPSLTSTLTPSVLDGRLDVGTDRHASGTFLLPYYVCNSGRLAPTVLRVVLRRAKPLEVVALKGRPHTVRVHNPNPATVMFEIGNDYAGLTIGRVHAHDTRTFHTPLTTNRWQGTIGRHGGYAGSGHLRFAS